MLKHASYTAEFKFSAWARYLYALVFACKQIRVEETRSEKCYGTYLLSYAVIYVSDTWD
jgi:hypothetical protein